jgi:hypothetical protein
MTASDDDRTVVANLLHEAASERRRLTAAEVEVILKHVASAGFDPTARETGRRPLEGGIWQGQRLTTRSRLPPEVRHWLLHARVRQEWPNGTTQHQYVESLRRVLLDPDSGIFVNHYKGELSLGAIRESRALQGPGGFNWVLVQYRVATGHWTTGFQPADGLDEIEAPDWGRVIWLRMPTIRSGSI